MNAVNALIILNGLLASATQVSALVQKMQAEGRTELTADEWKSITDADDAARTALSTAIANAPA